MAHVMWLHPPFFSVGLVAGGGWCGCFRQGQTERPTGVRKGDPNPNQTHSRIKTPKRTRGRGAAGAGARDGQDRAARLLRVLAQPERVLPATVGGVGVLGLGLCIVVKLVVWCVMLSVAADPPRCWYQPRKPPQSIPPAHRHSTHTSCWGGRWSGRSRTWCGSPGRSWSGSRGSPSACARSRGPGTPGTGSTGAVEGWLVDGSVYVDRRLPITHTHVTSTCTSLNPNVPGP